MPTPADGPVSDPARLAVLEATGLLDDAGSAVFDRLARLVELTLRVPVALVSLVAADRQVFAAQRGLPAAVCAAGGTPLSHSFCAHVVDRGAPFVVEDARTHPLVADNPAVEELGVVGYLGVPLRSPGGAVLGSLCAIADAPRRWADGDVEVLEGLAAAAQAEIAARARLDAEAAALRDALGRGGALFRAAFDALGRPAYVLRADGAVAEANAAALAGRPRAAVVGQEAPARLDVRDVPGTGLRLALG